MAFNIINRYTGAVLYASATADDIAGAVIDAVRNGANLRGANLRGAYLSRAGLRDADLRDADLSGADLRDADLRDADLSGADLRDADLSGADLRDADLSGANLSRANLSRAGLSGADLSGTNGVTLERTSPLAMLRDQPGPIRAYKLVTSDGYGPVYGGLLFEVGTRVEVANASTDPMEQCAPGVNIATLDWCMREWRSGYRILVVEFTAADIAAIPLGTDGKFRLHRCSVVAEKDLVALGLVNAEAA